MAIFLGFHHAYICFLIIKANFMKKKQMFFLPAFAFLLLASFTVKEPLHPSPASAVTITNKYWTSLRLQIRVGNYTDPMRNQLVCDKTLKKGESVSFSATSPNTVIYRRDSNPDNSDGVHFTNWTFSHCNSDCVIDNP